MNRRVSYLQVVIGFLVLLMAVPPLTLAQSSVVVETFRQEELDQMLAPIALYPDSLLGQILVAATYPEQVIDADQWVRQNGNLQGDEMNAVLDGREWDLSVKALVPFPQVLAMMSDKREWTQRMGDAFMVQQADVMDTIQRLRAKAHAAGHLITTDQQRVVVRGESIEILPANPRVVYVPTYNPSVIYGSWWYPEYPPYAYNPYYPRYAYDPHYSAPGFVSAGLFGFATGIAVGSVWNSGWGRWDWGRRDVNINVVRNININRNNLPARSFRTTTWNSAVQQGTVGSARHSGLRNAQSRDTVRQGARTRPSAASVQQGLQQRQGRGQARVGTRPDGRAGGSNAAAVAREPRRGGNRGGDPASVTRARRGGGGGGEAAAVAREPRRGGGRGGDAASVTRAPRGGGGGAAAVSAPRGGGKGGGSKDADGKGGGHGKGGNGGPQAKND